MAVNKIYLSSTYIDLVSFRDAIGRSLRRINKQVVGMEDYVATDQRPLDKCLNDVAAADVYIGLFAHRYGYIPGTCNPDNLSITELEFRHALKCGKPCLIFQLSDDVPWKRQFTDEVTGDGDSGRQIKRLRAELSSSKMVSFFKSEEELAVLVVSAITNLDTSTPLPKPDDTSRVFLPPRFHEQILRPSVLKELETGCANYPIMTIEGLPGAGKTYVAASFVSALTKANRYQAVLWHDPQENELLETLLSDLANIIPVVGSSPTAKCKDLVTKLVQKNTLLVVDDFHRVDPESFSILTAAASAVDAPAHLVILSRTFVDTLRGDGAVGHVVVRGFQQEELRSFLAQRGVSLQSQVLDTLLNAINGLPLAALLFATLVRQFNRKPSDLLRDTMVGTERLKRWFAEIERHLKPDDRALLLGLSLWGGPFNINVPMALGDALGIETLNLSFDRIQRMYLIQEYSQYRWNIHSLIALFCTANISVDTKTLIHAALARYALKGIALRAGHMYSDREFVWLVLACKHFQKAGRYAEAEEILHSIAKTAKLSGNVLTYIQLARTQVAEASERDTWIDYHLAHCCHIAGRLSEGLRVLEPHVNSRLINSNKAISFARLYAEFLGAMGTSESGYKFLSDALTSVRPETELSRVVLSQALSTKVWLLTRLGKYSDAEALLAVLRDQSMTHEDKLGKAINDTRSGILKLCQGFHHQAVESLSAALLGFKECGDNRGRAWCLGYMALGRIKIGRRKEAISNLRESMRLQVDMQSCSVDYYDVLVQFRKLGDSELSSLVEAEYLRIKSVLDAAAS